MHADETKSARQIYKHRQEITPELLDFNAGLLSKSLFESVGKIDQWFSVDFRVSTANAMLVPKFHIVLPASH
jgi:hypothetical protein